MIVLSFIVSSITIQANDLTVPSADVNIRTMNYTYQTNISDEILYFSTRLPMTFAGKPQVIFIQYTDGFGSYINPTSSPFGGAKVRYFNSINGSLVHSESLTLNAFHSLNSEYSYFEIQLVFSNSSSVQQERQVIENDYLLRSSTYALTISEGVALNINNLQDIYNNAFDAGELSGYESGYDQGYSTGYYYGTLNTQEGLASLPIAFVGGLNAILGINFGGVTLGALIMIPISIGLFLWFIKFSRK